MMEPTDGMMDSTSTIMLSRRGKILVILVACAVIGLAVWGGTLIGAARANAQQEETQSQLTAAKEELSRLQTSYTTLQQDTVALRTQLVATEASLSKMQSSYVTVQQDNLSLRSQQTSADSAISKMQSSHTDLQQENGKLQGQLASLTTDYNSLKIRYDALEKTKAFLVDGRLRVNLSTEQQFGAVTWMRGEVTNVGSVAVQKIYVFVSRYKSDGSLDSVDLPPAIIVNLGAGSTSQFSFIATGSTSKVTVLGDY